MAAPLTRRSAVAALVSATAIASVAPITAAAMPASTTAWTQALARYRTADAAFRIANTAHDEAESAYINCRPERPTFTVDMEGDYGRFGRHVLPVTVIHSDLDDPDREWSNPGQIAEMREQLARYRTADAAIRRELRLDALEDHEQAQMQRQCAALKALLATPAPNLGALAEKLAIMLAEYDDEDDATASVLADVRCLAGEA